MSYTPPAPAHSVVLQFGPASPAYTPPAPAHGAVLQFAEDSTAPADFRVFRMFLAPMEGG